MPSAGQLEQQIPQLATRDRIDARGWLVQKHHARLVHQRRAQRQALLPATRQVARKPIHVRSDVCELDSSVPSQLTTRFGEPIDLGVKVEIFQHRQVFVERESLAHVADLAANGFALLDHV